MNWVTLRQYSLPYEAHLDRARLESEGITAVIADEHTIAMQWMLSDALGGVRLRVQPDDLARAERILAEDRSDLVDEPDSHRAPAQTSGSSPMRLAPLATSNRKRGFFATLLALFIGS
ncbi:MAG: DUF2007 domain-containing protein [Marinobacter sp.]|uniref:putative signal transducing protein n=1 Tax=Marinobacter sp. TaxID=50741 RepID=UPI00299D6850|nr:DUF2007 domain-containing protein [Marinobacter sp.]MDX1634234.1 DUF2007 domain-containing protein [Marinobacter sp.]